MNELIKGKRGITAAAALDLAAALLFKGEDFSQTDIAMWGAA